MNDLEFCQQLVSATGIALSPGRGFGPGGVGFVRFALVQPEAVLQQRLWASLLRACEQPMLLAQAEQLRGPAVDVATSIHGC
jgi:aspartate/methionine/tyrosine aminotransferase